MSGECNYCGGPHAEAACNGNRSLIYANGFSLGHADGHNRQNQLIATLRAEVADLQSLVCEVALGITHSTACTPETPCVRCERDALRAEAERLRVAGEHFIYAMDSFRSGGVRVEGVQAAEEAFRTAVAKS